MHPESIVRKAYRQQLYRPHLEDMSVCTNPNLNVVFKARNEIKTSEFEALFNVFRANMYELYASVGMWDEKAKVREMSSKRSLYLIIYDLLRGSDDGQKSIAGFVHFRFEVEMDVVAVLYLYEVQVGADYQGQGLGRYLMDVCERMGAQIPGISGCALTVFRHNPRAMAFYIKQGYTISRHSPSQLIPLVVRRALEKQNVALSAPSGNPCEVLVKFWDGHATCILEQACIEEEARL